MACRHKEYVNVCEILVCVDTPAPLQPGLYSRLRFGLLASLWLPVPLGIFLWSGLHVTLLVIGGPVFWVLGLLAAFLFSVMMCGLLGTISCCLFANYIVLMLMVDLGHLLFGLIWFCWTLVLLLACQEPCCTCPGCPLLTFELCKGFLSGTRDILESCRIPLGVPCMGGSLYQQTKNQKLETWARWWEEVVHKHDAIAV